jgi:nicotinamidase-related amidase
MKQAFGLQVPELLPEFCDPSRCALLIYDMQNGIVSQIGEGPAIVRNCARLLEAARAAEMRIFFLRHFFLPNQAIGIGQLRRAMVWQRKGDPGETQPFITQGSPAWEIVPELSPLPGEVLIDKITMSAFEGTFLSIAMRDAQLTSFIIAGIALEIGIEPTIRHGLDQNFLPILVTDACGAGDAELKEHSLRTLEHTGEVIAVETETLVSALKQPGKE